MEASVRVFLPTYRRPEMLKGAIQSLLAQDFTHWVCEVRNNDLAGSAVVQDVVDAFGDPRIKMITNVPNCTALMNFNGCFRSVKEPFCSILEDDNLWKPQFLSRMMAHLEAHPQVRFAWSNQDIRYETADGWLDSDKTVTPAFEDMSARLVYFGHERQILGSLHSNSAMLFRSEAIETFLLPSDLPVAAMELFRDRVLPYPLLYVPEVLATFSVTRGTVRSKSAAQWTEMQALTAASFLKYGKLSKDAFADLLERSRAQAPPSTNSLLLGTILSQNPEYKKLFRLSDWLHLLQTMVHHPKMFLTLAIKKRHPEWWNFIDAHTARQFANALSPMDDLHPSIGE